MSRHAFTLRELRNKSDDDLIKDHDELASRTTIGINYYREELDRRSRDKQEKVMIILSIANFSAALVAAVATII